MSMGGNLTVADRKYDLATLIEHSHSVRTGQSLESVYKDFQAHMHEFVAVLEKDSYVGMVSRGQVGFLLGARFGFALYAKQPVMSHLIHDAVAVNINSGLMNVLSRTLSRTGKSFYDDVALLDEAGRYIGMIPVRRLIVVQSEIVADQARRSTEQQEKLAEVNQQLFKSLNELRQSQGRYDALLRNSALGVALLNTDGIVEVCNPRTDGLLGMSVHNVEKHKNLADWVIPGERAGFLDLLQKHEADASGQLALERDFRIMTPHRGARLFRFFTTWIVETGQVCVQFHDVTEQRALEKQAALSEKSALFESLVGGIAHELNNKLSPVLGFAELLNARVSTVEGDCESAEYCSMIVKSTEEAAKLVRQLLQLSRPAAVETSLSNLGNLVSEAASVLAYRMRELGVLLEMSVEQPKVEIMVDPAQIKQVVINLMLNAMDAMEKSPRKELRVKTGIAGGKASLTVSDTGHGINPEDLNRIFDPFFTTKSPDRGTGLGLSVCLSILKYHQGEITVESLHGAGAVFRVLLPLAPHGAANRSAAVQQKTETPKRDSPGRGRLKVMIVDDEHYVTALVQEILRKTMGWQVERAHNGREAVDWLKGETANLLISDVRMPEMNGLDLYKWVKDNKPDLTSRMLFVTGDAGSAELTGALHALGCPVLYKPFTAATLIEHCHRLISD